ncbi:MAG: glycosyltransferase family 4 protein [Chitinophagaceae bacterium]|nr:glycosyltransferase family 4 protein [Chitinophagaceae bacterium]
MRTLFRVAIISEYNHFTGIGGTEYYVKLLIHGLCKFGHEVIFITKGKQLHGTEVKVENKPGAGFTVYFLPSLVSSVAEIKQEKVSAGWGYILPVLEKFDPDVIHVHTLSTFFNRVHFELCALQFKGLVFTSHVPEHYCVRGDLIQNGQHPCDGMVGAKCMICQFSKSIVIGASNALHQYHSKRINSLLQLQKIPVQFICVSKWQKKQLVSNGFDEKKIDIVRQALLMEEYTNPVKKEKRAAFSIGYLGRLTPEKGADLLLQLIKKVHDIQGIRFVLGIPLQNSFQSSVKKLKKIISECETEIVLLDSIGHDNKGDFFNEIDCLLIPSFFIETGPIVLLEAVLNGKKVIAPDIGGPLEFAAEFPEHVVSYTWNNTVAAVEAIKRMKNENAEINKDCRELFMKREEQFISDQLEVYEKVMDNRVD